MTTFENIDKILSIIDCINFDKIQSVMKFLNWEWYETGVPCVRELKYQALSMLIDTYRKINDKEQYIIECGGFKAECFKCEDKYDFRLSFVLEEINSLN